MKVPFLDLSLQHRSLRADALAALESTYDGHRFCLGKDVEDFEKAFADAFGHRHVLGMNSGTSPLHVAMVCGKVDHGDEVIVPAFTFISSAWGASYVGARPRFVDIEPDTFNLDPVAVEAAITPRTKAIVVVHLFGQPARMDEILAIAARHRLFVIEDCAQAVSAKYRGLSVGSIGDAGTFSFYPTKNLGGVGEGGAFTSRHELVYDKAKLLRVHGSARRYFHDEIGFNYRMDGFQAAVLSVKLRRLADWTARRQEIARRYREGIRLADTLLPVEKDYGASVYHQFTLRHPTRDALREHLQTHEIGTDLIYPKPLHLQPCYAFLEQTEGSLPVAEKAAATCLSLPIFPELTDAQVDHVITTINRF